MDFSLMLDVMQSVMASTRSQYHLTLGELYDVLKKTSKKYHVVFDRGAYPDRLFSYRGYYSDLAFSEGVGGVSTVKDVLKKVKDAIGTEFTGYKGGEFCMTEETPLWKSEYGYNSGVAIVSAEVDHESKMVILHTVHTG